MVVFFSTAFCLQLLPEYQTNFYCFANQSPGSQSIPIVFSTPFTAPPQIVISCSQINIASNIQSIFVLKPLIITQNGFTLSATSQNYVYQFCIVWLAFLDQNVYSEYLEITQIMTIDTQIQIQLQNQLSFIPKATLFVNGINVNGPDSSHYQFQLMILSIDHMHVEIQVNIDSGFTVSYYTFSFIYGSPQYLNAGQDELYTLGTIQLALTDDRTKETLIGFSGITKEIQMSLRVFNAYNLITTDTDTEPVSSYVISYFNYMPCPLYCTTCAVAAPNCDGCLASTQRIGDRCTICQAHTFLPYNDSFDCADCGPYCDSCFGSAINCGACSSTSLRTGLPSCTTCPSQMFVQAGIVNCQTCSIYCNECSVSSTNCTACQANTLRSNPPNCSCPSQFHQIYHTAVCQPCLPYCNNCLDYSSDCIACSSVSMRIDPPNCTTCPQNMYVNQDTCTTCDSTCQTCDQSGCLTCLANQFINNLHQCVNCPSHCLTCDINTCYTCATNCTQCDSISCLACHESIVQTTIYNYYISGTNCIKCNDNCTQCDAFGCLTCMHPTILVNHTCQCQSPCLTCNQNHCLTCISTEYRLYNQSCQYCPRRCLACDSNGTCLQGPQYCISGIFIGNSDIQCTQCHTSYYLSNNFCLPCQNQCLACSLQSKNCITCRFPGVSQSECKVCESEVGQYSDYNNNNCYTICGDGLTAYNEQCDDGNFIIRDGCSNCQIDQGFTCSEMVCQEIRYPIPTLTQILTHDSLYNNTKSYLLSYNVPIIVNNLQIDLSIKGMVNFTFTCSQINSQTFQIILYLYEQSLDSQLLIQFCDFEINKFQEQRFFVGQQHFSDDNKILKNIIGRSIHKQFSQFYNVIPSHLTLSILCGGLDIFWNLLDLLQMISYLKYINTDKPFVLDQYFNLFNFLQFQNLPVNIVSYVPIQVQSYFNSALRDPPLQLQNDGYTCSSLLNFIPILNVLLMGILLYYLAKITCYFLINLQIFIEVSKLKMITKLKNLLFDLMFYVYKSCQYCTQQWKWNGMIRLFCSSVYEICFMIFLGIYGYSESMTPDQYFTLISSGTFLFITYIISDLTGYLQPLLLQNQLSVIYEGLRLSGFAKYYHTILIYKKTLSIMSLILLYNEPFFQIMIIIKGQIIMFIYLFYINPLVDPREKIKQCICECFMLIAQIQLAILIIDHQFRLFSYDYRKICGLVCVFTITIIIISQVVIDSLQQYQMYYNKYTFIRKCFDSIRNTNFKDGNQQESWDLQHRNFIM